MYELSVFQQGGVDVIDSRSVAEAIEKPHNDLMKSIRNYAEIIGKAAERKSAPSENPYESNERNFAPVENSNESNFGLVEKSTEPKFGLSGNPTAGNFSLSDFFIPHTYTDSTGRTLPCYLLTKKGCDMVANKMTGEKGVLFTAAYVTAFEKMRQQTQKPMTANEMFAMQAQINLESERKLAALEGKVEKTSNAVMTALNTFAAPPTDEERWRDEMNRRVRAMCEEYGLNYHTTIGDMYAELEDRARVNLSARQKNLQARMRRGGATVAECRSISKLMIISQDAKLRCIYETIVREKQAQLAASRLRAI